MSRIHHVVRGTLRSPGCGLMALTVVLASCGEAPPSLDLATYAAWDSAGIRVVEHSSLPIDPPRWLATVEPDLRIGTVEGSGADVFGSVAAVAENETDVIVVADGQADELRAFDPAGSHLWTAGRPGQGPGEFSGVQVVGFIRGDSVAAYDVSSQRVTIFTPDGRYARDYSVAALSRRGSPTTSVAFARSSSGLVGLASISALPEQLGASRYEGRAHPLFFDADGALVAEGAEMFGGDFVLNRRDRGWARQSRAFDPKDIRAPHLRPCWSAAKHHPCECPPRTR